MEVVLRSLRLWEYGRRVVVAVLLQLVKPDSNAHGVLHNVVHADRLQVEIPDSGNWLNVGGLEIVQIHLATGDTGHLFDVLQYCASDVGVDFSLTPEVVEQKGDDQVD